ncbi:preprotein translocase subunit SecG [Alteromonas aestuariivivens]|uniref:Protein-export membrane protein SecG n=1 Tax=Alteromonas aestuariivivens TaxID=1938339 RepID=A0A3D8M8Q0_9ALTE|nr:preprotein translocase subunit SecG [Alteromonas aestuariivivens]RDV26112.1 preprotein translocase subunit SecG [Alteromonas aestuariivivens]
MIYEVLLVGYLIVALLLIGFVLIQQGKGADMGASFGSGGSNTVFGSTGSGNFMTKTTGILATLFFLISLVLGNLSSNREKGGDEWENLEVPVEQQQPVNIDVPVTEEPASDVPAAESSVSDVPEAAEDSATDVPN